MKTLIVLLLAAVVGAGNAQTPGEGRNIQDGRRQEMRPGRGFPAGGSERLKELLNLSDETADKIEQLGIEHRKSQIALRAKLAEARVDFRALMRRDDADEKLAMAKQREMSGIREELQASALAHRFAISKLLTPEQRKILKEHRGGMMDTIDGFRGDRGRRSGDDRFMKHRRGMRHPPMMERDDE